VQSSEFIATKNWLPLERSLAKKIENYPLLLIEAAQEHNPSKLAIYLFELAKIFNSFYAELSIAQAESDEKQLLRIKLSKLTAQILERGLNLLGIQAPQRM
jgi:arginyl-tRNA synthetase